MRFPLNKKISINSSSSEFLNSYKEETQIPLYPHPGSFAFVRKNHQHEGVDLYAEMGDAVYAMEKGVIIDIFPFTGEIAQSPWWNNTWGILVRSENYTINYGEIIPSSHFKIGDNVEEGDCLGTIETVLKKDKGRPMNMLHLEVYSPGTHKAITSWDLGQDKPVNLLDPTALLLELKNKADFENSKYSTVEANYKIR